MKSINSGYTININQYQNKSSQFNKMSDKIENGISNSNKNILDSMSCLQKSGLNT